MIPLAGQFRTRWRTRAVMLGLGSIGMGMVLTIGLVLLQVMFTFLGGEVDTTGPVVFGAVVAVIGVALAIVAWVKTPDRPSIVVEHDTLRLAYPGFSRPLIVPRGLVRLVAIDDRPLVMFQKNERFRVTGDLPDGVFADPLDRYGLGRPPVVYGTQGSAAIVPVQAGVDEPSHAAGVDEPLRDGWATIDSRPLPWSLQREEGWLYGPDGSALPFLRLSIAEVPNVAIVFGAPLVTPATLTDVLPHRRSHHPTGRTDGARRDGPRRGERSARARPRAVGCRA
jgi:hypothetical protein